MRASTASPETARATSAVTPANQSGSSVCSGAAWVRTAALRPPVPR